MSEDTVLVAPSRGPVYHTDEDCPIGPDEHEEISRDYADRLNLRECTECSREDGEPAGMARRLKEGAT